MRFASICCFLMLSAVLSATASDLWGQAAQCEQINQWVLQLQRDEGMNPAASPSAAGLIEQGSAAIPAIRALLLDAKNGSHSSDSYAVRLPNTDRELRISKTNYSRACKWTLYVLTEIGPESVPLLVEAANQGRRNRTVSDAAGEALRRLHPSGVDELVKLLDSPQKHVRHTAIYQLGRDWPCMPSRIPGPSNRLRLNQLRELERMVDIWIAASRNGDYYVRYKALCAMKYAGEYDGRVLPILIKALEDRGSIVRQGACDALAHIGIDNADALNALLRAVQRYPDTSNLAYALVQRHTAAIPGLLKALDSPNPAARGMASDVLARLGPSAADVAQISQALKGVEFDYDLPGHLADIGPEVVPILEHAYKHGNQRTRRAVVHNIEKLGGSVVPLLVNALKDSDPYVRGEAASTLGRIKEKVPVEAIPDLNSALRHSQTVEAAARALCNAGPEAIPSLAWGLQHGGEKQRSAIISAMRRELLYGDKAAYTELVPNLVSVLDDSGHSGRQGTLELFKLTGTEAVPALVTVIENAGTANKRRALELLKVSLENATALKPPTTRKPAMPRNSPSLLGWLFAGAPSSRSLDEGYNSKASKLPSTVDVPRMVALLQQALLDDDTTVRLRGVNILALLGPDSAPAVLLLVDRLRKDETCIRVAASKALGRIGAAAVPALIDGLRDEQLRDYAADALSRAGPAAVPALLELEKSEDRSLRNLAGDIVVRLGAAAVGPLAKALKDPDVAVRRWVTFTLGSIGAPAVPALIEALDNEDAEIRMLAADGLGRIGSDAAQAVPHLIVTLEDEDERIRLVAVDALGAIGAEAGAAADDLAAVLQDRILRARAAEALGKIEASAVPVLVKAFQHQDPGVQEAAIYAIGRAGKGNQDVVEPLVAVLKGNSETARLLAADSLGRVGAVAVPALVRALNDRQLPERWLAALALGRMGEDAVEAVSALADALEDEDEQVRSASAYALSEIGPKAADALPALKGSLTHAAGEAKLNVAGEARLNVGWALWTIGKHVWGPQVLSQTLTHDELHVRVASAVALGKIGPDAARAVPKLADALADESPKVRAAVARALGLIGAKAKTAVPALEESLKTAKSETRLNVGWALWKICEHRWAIPVLKQALESKEAAVRATAATLLGRIGKPAASAASALTLALRDRHAQVRSAAALALGEIGSATDETAEILTELRDQSVGESRLNSAWALWQLKKDKSAIRDLIATLTDPNPDVRCGAAAALGQIGSEAKQGVPALALALGDESAKVRAMAAAALSHMGTDAAPATPALLEAVCDEDEQVRKHAVSALFGTSTKFYQVMPTLVQAMEGKDPEIRRNVALAMVEEPDEDKEPVPTRRLIEVLRQGNDDEHRCTAAIFLATRDDAKHSALSDLQKAVKEDESTYVQWCAKWSLSILQPVN